MYNSARFLAKYYSRDPKQLNGYYATAAWNLN